MLNDYKDTEMTIKGNLQPIKVIKRPQNKEKEVIRCFFTKHIKRYKKD